MSSRFALTRQDDWNQRPLANVVSGRGFSAVFGSFSNICLVVSDRFQIVFHDFQIFTSFFSFFWRHCRRRDVVNFRRRRGCRCCRRRCHTVVVGGGDSI